MTYTYKRETLTRTVRNYVCYRYIVTIHGIRDIICGISVVRLYAYTVASKLYITHRFAKLFPRLSLCVGRIFPPPFPFPFPFPASSFSFSLPFLSSSSSSSLSLSLSLSFIIISIAFFAFLNVWIFIPPLLPERFVWATNVWLGGEFFSFFYRKKKKKKKDDWSVGKRALKNTSDNFSNRNRARLITYFRWNFHRTIESRLEFVERKRLESLGGRFCGDTAARSNVPPFRRRHR